MAFAEAFYNTIVKRNSVFVPAIFAGAFAFNMGFDIAISQFWDHWNRGRQWKDIRGRYIQDADES